jgi:voltage-gated sodium channel
MNEKKEKIGNWLISEKMIMAVIILNSFLIFLMAFPEVYADRSLFFMLVILDEICLIYFLIEVILKIRMKTFKVFWERAWDKFDLILVIITFPMIIQLFVPSLMEPQNGNSELFRKIFKSFMLLRLIRLLKLMKFVPNSTMLIEGIKRALKASIGVIISLFILNLIFALGATILFDNIDGAQPFFGDPLNSMYTMFKIFTVEGWYEIPDMLIDSIPDEEKSNWMIFVIRSYFIVSVGTGGLLGLSLANAIFVDEMTLDNNMKLEGLIEELTAEVRELKEQVNENNTKL